MLVRFEVDADDLDDEFDYDTPLFKDFVTQVARKAFQDEIRKEVKAAVAGRFKPVSERLERRGNAILQQALDAVDDLDEDTVVDLMLRES